MKTMNKKYIIYAIAAAVVSLSSAKLSKGDTPTPECYQYSQKIFEEVVGGCADDPKDCGDSSLDALTGVALFELQDIGCDNMI